MKSPYSTIDTILITEKATRCSSEHNQYVFKTAVNASKPDIKMAVEKLFGVHVTDVRTMIRKGKRKRERTIRRGMTSAFKKAIVSLKEGEKIEIV